MLLFLKKKIKTKFIKERKKSSPFKKELVEISSSVRKERFEEFYSELLEHLKDDAKKGLYESDIFIHSIKFTKSEIDLLRERLYLMGFDTSITYGVLNTTITVSWED